MIEVQNLTKQYGPFTAVNDVSFKVERGEILGFLGPNGAGKTTTMRILTGYMPPTEGKAIVAGYDVLDQPLEAKRRTGYLPETPPLYPDMTVREYLDLLRAHQGRAAGRAQNARGFGDGTHPRSTTWPSATAPSSRRATGSASAWLRRCCTIPTCSSWTSRRPVSTRSRSSRRGSLIKELAGNHTIVLSTHILPEVSQTCDRVVIINKGRIVAVDSVDKLTARADASTALYVQVDAAGQNPSEALQAVHGRPQSGARRHAGRLQRPRGSQRGRTGCPPRRGGGDRRTRLGTARAANRSGEPRGRVPPPHH